MTTIKVEDGDWGLFYPNDKPVHHADMVWTFRGELVVVTGGTAPRTPESTGRVHTNRGAFSPA